MSATTNPELLIMPLARDGEKNTLPETTGVTTGEFSQQYGFQQINSTPLTAGGKAPDRKDMNGAFNLLGGVAYYAQKGWTFHYDSTQDYYLGCVVIDPADGNRYECIADMAAGTVAPHEDTDGDYWRRFYAQELAGKANITGSNMVYHCDVITTSGTYTAPVTGLYKITVKGGGGGGTGGGYNGSAGSFAGGGGGEGGTTITYAKLIVGDTVPVTIGAGGTGGSGVTTPGHGNYGGSGGNSTITIGTSTYTAGGGNANGVPGRGGTGTIVGSSTIAFFSSPANISCCGGAGAGIGGGGGGSTASNGANGVLGAGGGGGGAQASTTTATSGGTGGNGYCWFEYYTPGA